MATISHIALTATHIANLTQGHNYLYQYFVSIIQHCYKFIQRQATVQILRSHTSLVPVL